MSDSGPPMNTWGLVRTFFDSALIVVSLLGNGMVVLILLSDRRLRTSLNILLANLAAADLLVGAAVGPLSLISENGLVSSRALCVLLNCFLLGVAQASIFSLLALSIDRYLSLRAPFLYSDAGSLRRRLVSLALVLSWTLGFAVGSFPAVHLLFGSPSSRVGCLSSTTTAAATATPLTTSALSDRSESESQLLTENAVDSSAALSDSNIDFVDFAALSIGQITNPLSDNVRFANSPQVSAVSLTDFQTSDPSAPLLRPLEAASAQLAVLLVRQTTIAAPTSSPVTSSSASQPTGSHMSSENFRESANSSGAPDSSSRMCSFEKVVDFRLLAFVHSLPGVLLPLVIIALIYLRVFSISQAHARSILGTLNFSMLNMNTMQIRASKVSNSFMAAGPCIAGTVTGTGTGSGSGGAGLEGTSMSTATSPAAAAPVSPGIAPAANWNVVEYVRAQNGSGGSHEHLSLKPSVNGSVNGIPVANGHSSGNGGGGGGAMNYTLSCSTEEIDDRERARRRRRWARSFADQRKSARLVGLVIASMAICWLPLHTHNVLRALRGDPQEGFPEPLYHTAIWLSHAHSAVNPLIYALLHTGFRAALKARLCGRRTSVNDSRPVNRVAATSFKDPALRYV